MSLTSSYCFAAMTLFAACAPADRPPSASPSVSVHIGHVSVPHVYRVDQIGRDRSAPHVDAFTIKEISYLRADLTAKAWRELRYAFLGSGQFVVFAAPSGRYSSAAQSLLDCYANPPCRHYCPVFVVFAMNDTSVMPSESARCADSLSIWKKA
jgi:hypothetical protein